MPSGQLRISLLNPGVEITPLRLRGWLQKEAAAIHGRCGPDDGTILRLFLTPRLRYAQTGEKLDRMLQTLVERYPSILRIETQLIDAPLDQAAMDGETRRASADLQKFIQHAQAHTRAQQAAAEARARSRVAPIQWHKLGFIPE